MAKRGTITSTKNRRLAAALTRLLGHPVELWQSHGMLESVWHAVAKRAPRGDIGRITNQDLADEIWFSGDADALVGVLVDVQVLHEHEELRLVVHGWSEHADNAVRQTLARNNWTFWDGQPPRAPRASREDDRGDTPAEAPEVATVAAPEPSGHTTPQVETCDHAVDTRGVMSSRVTPTRAKPEPEPSQSRGQRREAGGAGGRRRTAPAPPARPPSLADSIDHDPDDPDQRRLAERLAGIERQIAERDGRPPSPGEVRKLLGDISTPPGGRPLDSLRKASPDWLAVTYAHCAHFERGYGPPPLLSPDELAEAWIDARGGPSVVALGVRAWIADHAPDEPIDVAVERWALEPGEDEVPAGVVEALLPHLRRIQAARADLRAAG